MTDLANVQAFREFDARIAEGIMGWKNCRPHQSFDLPISGVGFGVGDPPEGWEGHLSTQWRRYMIPPFTTDDGAAMLVLEELRRRFRIAHLVGESLDADKWFCSAGGGRSGRGSGPTIALAVCRCALESVKKG